MRTLLLLFSLTILLEFLLVLNTILVSRGKKLSSAFLSALIEPAKFISIIIIVSDTNKLESIIVISLACFIGTYLTMALSERMLKNDKMH